MASFFKGRSEGSTPPANDSASPNENSKKWISGLVSGAGKIISSVFRSSDASDSECEEDDTEMLSSGLFFSFCLQFFISLHNFTKFCTVGSVLVRNVRFLGFDILTVFSADSKSVPHYFVVFVLHRGFV